jgi:hypothetical protein
MELVMQFIALVVVLFFMGFYFSFIRHQTADWAGRSLLFLVALAMVGGSFGGIFWWFDVKESFSWDTPPLASRMLGAAGISFGVASFLAIRNPTYKIMRLMVINLAVYLIPLAAAIVLFHLDRFDSSAPITYVFFMITVGMSLASLYFLWQQPRIIPDQLADATPPTPYIRQWLLLVSIVTGLWGLALFITDKGGSDLIWVWAGDLLSSRLIGVMLLTIAAGCAYAWQARSTARLMLEMISIYSFGLALASLWNALADKPIKESYTGVFAVIFWISIMLLLTDTSPQIEPSPGHKPS